ncbi:M28 family peptidase [Tamlana fucoidanivorans]|uniref:M28 family peptidase n=1 Tax=Allotamlana fucoidanivorans TaxID=2583814 RepID=A0A5C4SKN6_9FLAO|nr:M28 family peptidase [Tamlana fucoidanivorans]TNJ44171.1 M28 family peptidase [Tamlana fucoidanivorans]
MLNHLKLLVFFILFFSLQVGTAQDYISIPESYFSKTSLLKHLRSLSSDAFEGRKTGTVGAKKARKYIINQFHALKVEPLEKSYEQFFSFYEDRKQYQGVNVIGLVKGKEFPKEFIVISAHYDHEGVKGDDIYNGADDNASGVSALFAFAEYFKEHPPKHSVILAAFDAEELGLQGSRFFINSAMVRNKKIVYNINMDMISRSAENELFAAGAFENKNLKYILNMVNTSHQVTVVPGHDGFDGLDNWTYASDHANFHKKEIPFLYFGVEDHEDYHEPTDTYENIHPKFYVEAVKAIIDTFKQLDNLSL